MSVVFVYLFEYFINNSYLQLMNYCIDDENSDVNG